MKNKRKLLSAALLAVVVSVPSFADPVEISEDQLEEVSAQGLQNITNANRPFSSGTVTTPEAGQEPKQGNTVSQNNNTDSTQLNDSAMMNAVEGYAMTSANSAVNTGSNFLVDGPEPPGPPPPPPTPDPTDKDFNHTFSQLNEQDATNHENNAEGEDVAIAANINKQTQIITNEYAIELTQQDNNNNSVQLNESSQKEIQGIVISNDAASAGNQGYNYFVANNITGTDGTQSNMQGANNNNNTADGNSLAVAGNIEIASGSTQTVNNKYDPNFEWQRQSDIQDQDNNNNSVQINNESQQNSNVGSLVNSAKTAYNGASNLSTSSDISDSSLIQTNTQTAMNHVNTASAYGVNVYEDEQGNVVEEPVGQAYSLNFNKQKQEILNMEEDFEAVTGHIGKQNNNNNSVQLNDSAQQNSTGLLLMNASTSAINVGYNLMDAGNVSNSTLSQTTNQNSENFNNYASANNLAVAGNAEPGATQYVHNAHVTIDKQNNNNNSVQLNDDAQQNISSFMLINSSMSAANISYNLMNVGDVSDSEITQTNTQVAMNHVNTATGGDAFAGNLNKETQIIENCHCSDISGEQNNNLNSVQLNGNTQGSETTILLLNTSQSAANMGLNILNAGIVSGSTVTQANVQNATNFSNTATGTNAAAGNAEMGGFYAPMPTPTILP